ncbi:MAG TPA: ATP-binding protein [Longimicrobium sp.]|nr:ATP-binding protein [Longimicrobium sp.]
MSERRNPFVGYGEVVYGERFVGREHGLALVRGYLSEPTAGSSIAIVGLPKVGKSSLLQQALMEDEARLVASRVLPLWLHTFQSLTGAELMRALVSRTADRLVWLIEDAAPIEAAAQLALAPADTWSELMHHVQEFFAEVRRRSWRPLFILDEFDAARQLYNGATSVFQGIRELATNPRFKVVFATISQRPVAEIEGDHGGSSLSEVLHKYRMPLFSDEECERLLQRLTVAGIEVTDEIRACAAETCGGHPYLLSRLCYELAEQAFRGEPLDLVQACSFPGAGESFTDHYGRLEEFLRDVGLYDKLLEIVIGPQVSATRDHVAALMAYGAIRPADGGGFSPFSRHYHAYLREQTHAVDLWPLWSETERRLRALLLREFTAKYADEWPDRISKAHAGAAEVIEGCRRRQAYEEGTRSGYRAHSLLDFAEPSDLWRLLSCEWSLFVGAFGRDRAYWARRFNDILVVRRAMAHSRPIASAIEHLHAQAACQEILACLDAPVR